METKEEKEEEKNKSKSKRDTSTVNLTSPKEMQFIVTNTVTYIEGSFASGHYKALKKELGYTPEDAVFMVRAVENKSENKWENEWDGLISTLCYNKRFCRCSVKHNGTHFPTGLLSKARKFFNDNDIPFTIRDNRRKISKNLELSISDEFEPRDYQLEIIDNAVLKGRGIIQMCTGGGKTALAAVILSKLSISPSIFYVTSIDLLEQARAELSRFIRQNGEELDVGVIGDTKCDIKDINVMTVQTAIRALGSHYVKYDEEDNVKENDLLDSKRKEIRDLILRSKIMISDEIQHWSCETCQTISDYSISSRYRFGLSATPSRDRGDDILIDACFGKYLGKIDASYLIKRDYLIKPKIYIIDVPNKKSLTVKTYPAIYKAKISENIDRNKIIADIAKKFADNGRIVLILCRMISHGKILKSLIPDSVFLCGASSSKQRKIHLDKMRNREAGVTIATVIFDEGIDCRPLDTLILAGSGKSPTRALQRVGRILRTYEGKKDAIVVDFMDNVKYLSSHSRKRINMYKTESEFEITKLDIN